MTHDDDDTTGQAARREIILQVIGLVGMGLAAAISVYVQRNASDPDYGRRVKMRTAKHLERWYATRAARYWKRAEKFRTEYEAERG